MLQLSSTQSLKAPGLLYVAFGRRGKGTEGAVPRTRLAFSAYKASMHYGSGHGPPRGHVAHRKTYAIGMYVQRVT